MYSNLFASNFSGNRVSALPLASLQLLKEQICSKSHEISPPVVGKLFGVRSFQHFKMFCFYVALTFASLLRDPPSRLLGAPVKTQGQTL